MKSINSKKKWKVTTEGYIKSAWSLTN